MNTHADAKTLTALPEASEEYVLQLFVCAHTENAERARENVTRFCQENLAGRYQLEVVDVVRDPDAAVEHHILATPTLLAITPSHTARIIGDFSDTQKVRAALRLPKVVPSGAE